MNTSLVIAGVGGQGTLLASKIIGGAAVKSGRDVKVSEVHGMSQRGGSVVTFVRYGDGGQHSPVVAPGEADTVLSFELLEAYRSLNYLKKGGLLVTNTSRISPMPVISGAASYPLEIEKKLSEFEIRLEALDANRLAVEAGSVRAVNLVLIGCYARYSGIDESIWRAVIEETVKPSMLEINLRAFAAGLNNRMPN
jgi:indolepyruvate ferredoxin oxidoreductase beta subunit